uniref:Uncharacterized protein n=1 Tax=Romanomermis culicivorax TaxID=13658 RepID=A0A915HPE7_ROMCU
MIHQVIISSVIFILCTVAAILTCAKKRKEKLQATPGDLTVTNYDLGAVEKSLLPENDDFQELLKIPSVDGNCTSQKQWKRYDNAVSFEFHCLAVDKSYRQQYWQTE